MKKDISLTIAIEQLTKHCTKTQELFSKHDFDSKVIKSDPIAIAALAQAISYYEFCILISPYDTYVIGSMKSFGNLVELSISLGLEMEFINVPVFKQDIEEEME